MKRLHFLLEKSGAYATILGRKLERQQEEARERAAQIEASETPDEPEDQPKRGKSRRTRAAPPLGQAAKKRKITDADYQLTDYIGDEVCEHIISYFLIYANLFMTGHQKIQSNRWRCE